MSGAAVSPNNDSDMHMAASPSSGHGQHEDDEEAGASSDMLTQESEGSQTQNAPLLTQAPSQSFSDDDDDDEYSSNTSQHETLSPNLCANQMSTTTHANEERQQGGEKTSDSDVALESSLRDGGTAKVAAYREDETDSKDAITERSMSPGIVENEGGEMGSPASGTFIMTQADCDSDGRGSADVRDDALLDTFESSQQMNGTDIPTDDNSDRMKTSSTPQRQTSSQSSQSESSSSSDDDDDEEEPDGSVTPGDDPRHNERDPTPNSYMNKRAKRILRNNGRLRNLGLIQEAPAPKKVKDSPNQNVEEDIPTGMLFETPFNRDVMNSADTAAHEDAAADIDRLYRKFPCRQLQIQMLISLISAAMNQVDVRPGEDPYVPVPIFVSGPSGTGKTAIVRNVLDCVKHDFLSRTDEQSTKHRIGTAYVNCATIEPSSLEAVVESAYSQLTSSFDAPPRRKRVKKRKKKRKRKDASNIPGQSEGGKTQSYHSGMMDDQAIDTEYNSEIEAEMEDKIEESRKQQNLDEQNDPIIPQAPSRVTRSLIQGTRSAANHTAPVVNVQRLREKSIRKVEQVTTSHSGPAAFGRVLAPLFGPLDKSSVSVHSGAAFLVLDHAERLFSLLTKQKNNYLSQLLLLPKVMGLNLTIIVVSRSTLLDCARINNTASVEKALNTIGSGICPIRVHFPAYKGKGNFLTILKQADVLERIVGNDYLPSESAKDGPRQEFQLSVIDSFLDTVVQSVSSITRDIREMIRMGRLLWPSYILPLRPDRIAEALETARRRTHTRLERLPTPGPPEMGLIGSEEKEIQKELLAILDEAILPQMKSFLDEGLYMIKGFTSLPKGNASSNVSTDNASSHSDLPYLSKCLLLAAFICQTNKPDKDKALFTIQRNGKKNSSAGPRAGINDTEGLAYGSTTWEQQRLKMLRPRHFSLERMLSVFVNMVGLIGGEEKLWLGTHRKDPSELIHSMGSASFFESLSRLREIGLIREVHGASIGGDDCTTFEGINLTSPKYWCELNREDAEAIAASVDCPLSNFIM